MERESEKTEIERQMRKRAKGFGDERNKEIGKKRQREGGGQSVRVWGENERELKQWELTKQRQWKKLGENAGQTEGERETHR